MAIALAFLVSFIGSILAIYKYAKSINKKILDPINKKLDKMDKDLAAYEYRIKQEFYKYLYLYKHKLAHMINQLT